VSKPAAVPPPPERDDSPAPSLDVDLSVHVFTVSATMVGVCLTAIGLIRVVVTIRHMETLVDDLIAMNALLFVISGLLSYWAMRSHRIGRPPVVEAIAEKVFLGAMVLTGIACLALVYGINTL